jgi:NADH-quinone oxidoreductase subunit E
VAAAYIAGRLGVAVGETTADGRFTVLGVECLGLCEQGPAMMIGDEAYGRLTPERIDEILDDLAKD